jgi:3'(2'), 5'-bisphosphate nucleotidase
VISRSRPPAFAERIARSLDAQLQQVGSAGAKAMMVVRGEAIAYVHEGGMNEWDAAAPAGVALAYGLHVSTLKGEPIRFNQRDVVLHDGLIICAKEVAQQIIKNL